METLNTSEQKSNCPYCGKIYHGALPDRCDCGYFFNKESYVENQTESVSVDNHYYGVKGWLLLFCLSLVLFNPLFTLYNLITVYIEASSLYYRYPGLEKLFYIDLSLSIALTAFSIYSGLKLLFIKPNAVKIAKQYLIAFTVYTIVASFLPFMVDLPNSITNELTGEIAIGVVRSFIYAGVWYSFLIHSKRVKATYQS
jgi:hypothetical protein